MRPMRVDMRTLTGATVLLVLCQLHAARADGWLVAETPLAIAVSDVQNGAFRPGLMPAVGFYVDNEHVALGLRLRAGVLRNGPAPGKNLADPGVGGLTTAGLAFRLTLAGGWSEVVVGGGLTGHDLVPSAEVGVGWNFAVGKVDVGPSVRFVRVVSRDRMDSFGNADLALVGVDVRFGKQRAGIKRVPRAEPRPEPAPLALVETPAVSDRDRVVDRELGCAEQLDGCPLAEDIVILDDRIVLDDRVLFDFDRTYVHSRGRELVASIARIWSEHPNWKRITVEGHTDTRGSEEHNLELSQRRADQVRAILIKAGRPADLITTVGYGRAHVRDLGTTEQAHMRNRRVEFVIEQGGER
jgi:outer membrane protein OmpA-like peptidoglycan-associated protein